MDTEARWIGAELNSAEDIAALVLAGGKSTRMGQGKASLCLHGKTPLERVPEAVASLCGEVVLVEAQSQTSDWLPGDYIFRAVEDLYPERGPLGGLYVGFRASVTRYNLVVGCDMPFLNRHLLAFLAEQARAYDAVVPLVNGRSQPLHAVYSQTFLEVAEGLLARKDAGLRELLAAVNTKYVSQGEIARYDSLLTSFFNVNTPYDLKEAKRLLESRKQGTWNNEV